MVLFVLMGILKNPQLSLQGASEGLTTWFTIVLPSLFPFFVISEILISTGFIEILGYILDPLMKVLFNLPGISAFPFSMSLISGYPTGSKIVANLRKDGLITRYEGEKILVISSTSGPLFMLGAVTLGMLGDISLAPLILYPHYLALISLGFLLRFSHGQPEKKGIDKRNHGSNPIKEKFLANNYPPIGYILMNSVKNSMNSLLLIGGFIIFYSVVIKLLFALPIFTYNYGYIINPTIIQGLMAGIIELTTGCKMVASSEINLPIKIALLNFIIAWGGLSIHSQALAFLSNTDLGGRKYLLAKFLHGLLAFLYSILLYFLKFKDGFKTTFLPDIIPRFQISVLHWQKIFINSMKLSFLTVLYLFLLGFLLVFLSLFCRKSNKP